MADFVKRFLPRALIRKHHQDVRALRAPTRSSSVTPPAGDPMAGIPRSDHVDAGRDELAGVLHDAQRRSGR